MGHTPAAAVGQIPIIVHSHLRWDFVWQRPQQILSRLASHHPILFLEEPTGGDAAARLELSEPHPNVVRAIPVIPARESMAVQGQNELVLSALQQALRAHPLAAGRFEGAAQWFYSPMTAPFFLERLGSACTVYDCMDELANFRFAPDDIAQRERLLLSHADVVFTGGCRLYESKSRYNPNTHFYGCGVDVEHFGKARLDSTVSPPEISALPRPVLGYFGVIDERLDYDLLDDLARAFPHASIAMVGPFAKVDPACLPQAPNVHWLGQRGYRDLPALVKGFDVCLMPFALNEATQYINPTKTLEYMAAAKPIVSTAVPDVVRNFTPIVKVADSGKAFATAVGEALARPDREMIAAGVARAGEASWDAIVTAIRGHLLDAVAHRRRAVLSTSAHPPLSPPNWSPPARNPRVATASLSVSSQPLFDNSPEKLASNGN